MADLSYVSYSNLTSYGKAGIRWDLSGTEFKMVITVPVGSTAVVYVPASDAGGLRKMVKKSLTKPKTFPLPGQKTDTQFSPLTQVTTHLPQKSTLMYYRHNYKF